MLSGHIVTLAARQNPSYNHVRSARCHKWHLALGYLLALLGLHVGM